MDEFFNKEKYNNPNYMKNHIVATRDNRPVRILCTNLKDSKPIIAAVEISPNCETVVQCYSNGRLARTLMSGLDIMFKNK